MFSRLRPQQVLLSFRSYATAPPSALDANLRSALKTAMKARDTFRTGVIRSALADLKNATLTGSTPAAESKTLARSVSSRMDAAATFDTSNPPRPDLAEQYRREATILSEFVEAEPEGLKSEELDEVVKSVMAELGLQAVGQDMGKVIKAVLEKAAGRAAGKDVSLAVKRFGKQ
ncbi:uncharacterized protein P7C70_g666, partial [Phenoliferia sp. Uapishka_3]